MSTTDREAKCGATMLVSDPEWCVDGPWEARCDLPKGHDGEHYDSAAEWCWKVTVLISSEDVADA